MVNLKTSCRLCLKRNGATIDCSKRLVLLSAIRDFFKIEAKAGDIKICRTCSHTIKSFVTYRDTIQAKQNSIEMLELNRRFLRDTINSSDDESYSTSKQENSSDIDLSSSDKDEEITLKSFKKNRKNRLYDVKPSLKTFKIKKLKIACKVITEKDIRNIQLSSKDRKLLNLPNIKNQSSKKQKIIQPKIFVKTDIFEKDKGIFADLWSESPAKQTEKSTSLEKAAENAIEGNLNYLNPKDNSIPNIVSKEQNVCIIDGNINQNITSKSNSLSKNNIIEINNTSFDTNLQNYCTKNREINSMPQNDDILFSSNNIAIDLNINSENFTMPSVIDCLSDIDQTDTLFSSNINLPTLLPDVSNQMLSIFINDNSRFTLPL